MNRIQYLQRIKAEGIENPTYSFLSKLQEQHLYCFSTRPRVISDFEEMCTYNQTSPESHFTQEIICTIATKNGRVSLSDKFLTITDGNSKRKITVDSDEDFKQKLRDHFEIQLNYSQLKNHI